MFLTTPSLFTVPLPRLRRMKGGMWRCLRMRPNISFPPEQRRNHLPGSPNLKNPQSRRRKKIPPVFVPKYLSLRVRRPNDWCGGLLETSGKDLSRAAPYAETTDEEGEISPSFGPW